MFTLTETELQSENAETALKLKKNITTFMADYTIDHCVIDALLVALNLLITDEEFGLFCDEL